MNDELFLHLEEGVAVEGGKQGIEGGAGLIAGCLVEPLGEEAFFMGIGADAAGVAREMGTVGPRDGRERGEVGVGRQKEFDVMFPVTGFGGDLLWVNGGVGVVGRDFDFDACDGKA